jgi:hypothetical protein
MFLRLTFFFTTLIASTLASYLDPAPDFRISAEPRVREYTFTIGVTRGAPDGCESLFQLRHAR